MLSHMALCSQIRHYSIHFMHKNTFAIADSIKYSMKSNVTNKKFRGLDYSVVSNQRLGPEALTLLSCWLYFGTKLNRDIELTDYLTLFANFRSNPRLFDTIYTYDSERQIAHQIALLYRLLLRDLESHTAEYWNLCCTVSYIYKEQDDRIELRDRRGSNSVVIPSILLFARSYPVGASAQILQYQSDAFEFCSVCIHLPRPIKFVTYT
jgi:hypothetical protein